MRKTIGFLTILTLFGAATLSSADRRNFWLLNNTGHKINSFYIAIHGTDESWGNDVLGAAAVPQALGTVIYFHDSNSRCVYDFRVGYADGTHQDYLQGRNLCDFHAVQFNDSTNNAF